MTVTVQGPDVMVVRFDELDTSVFADYSDAYMMPTVEVRIFAGAHPLNDIAETLRQIAEQLPQLKAKFERERERRTGDITNAARRMLRDFQSIDIQPRDKQEALAAFERASTQAVTDDFPF